MSKHTPGPWYWNRGKHESTDPKKREPRTLCSRSAKSADVPDDDLHILIPAAKMSAIAASFVYDIELEIHGKPDDEALIAAAPDLLAACEQIVAQCGRDALVCEMCAPLKAAIAKARGEA